MNKNKDLNPIFYKNSEEMNKPLSVLMGELRMDISKVRGKIEDIKRSYGWEERVEHLIGGLTCLLVAMYDTMKEMEKFENKKSTNESE